MSLLLFAIAQASFPSPSLKPASPVTEADRAAIRRYFDAKLLDGPSARWKFTTNTSGFTCGWVNSRNRMGAYAGWSAYYARLDRPGHVQSGDIYDAFPAHSAFANGGNVLIETICPSLGVDPTAGPAE